MKNSKKRIFRYKKEFVKNVELVYYDEDTNRRYRLDVELKRGDNNKAALLIMMNPSEANDKYSDHTINRVIKYIFLNNKEGILKDIGKIIFTNLYVVYEKDQKKVNDIIAIQGFSFVKGIEPQGKFNNNNIIRNATYESHVTIVAWGESIIVGYDDRIKEVLEIIKTSNAFQVEAPKSTKYPRHPRTWAYAWPLKTYTPKE